MPSKFVAIPFLVCRAERRASVLRGPGCFPRCSIRLAIVPTMRASGTSMGCLWLMGLTIRTIWRTWGVTSIRASGTWTTGSNLRSGRDSGFYATTAIADHGIGFLAEHAARYRGQPFFLYLAFNAPHFPLQAPQDDIERYRGRYRDGWESIRAERAKRVRELGIVNGTLVGRRADGRTTV